MGHGSLLEIIRRTVTCVTALEQLLFFILPELGRPENSFHEMEIGKRGWSEF